MCEKRNTDIFCVQETRWKRSKARSIELFYHGVIRKQNEVGIIMQEKYLNSIVEVKCVKQNRDFEARNQRGDVEHCLCDSRD